MLLDHPDFTQSTDRGPSPGLWNGFPTIVDLQENPTLGWYIWDDFTDIPFTTPTTEANWGRYKAFGSSGATLTDAGISGGVVRLTEATNNESVAIASVALPFKIASTRGKIGFEARIATSSIANTAHNTIIGLANGRTLIVGDPIDTAGVLISTLDFVGFQRVEADGDAMDATYQENGSTQVVSVANAVTLVADTFIKVGFVYDPQDGKLRWFVNGIANSTVVAASAITGAAFPNTNQLGLIFAHMAAATSPGTDDIDWWKCIQLPVDNNL